MFDIGSIAFFLVLAANLALIMLVAGLAADRAREAWSRAVNRARHAEAVNQSFRAGIEAAETKASQMTEQIAATKVKLEQTKLDAAALKQRHATEPLPFVFRGPPTETFDPGDRKSVGGGKRVTVHVDLGGRRSHKKNKKKKHKKQK